GSQTSGAGSTSTTAGAGGGFPTTGTTGAGGSRTGSGGATGSGGTFGSGGSGSGGGTNCGGLRGDRCAADSFCDYEANAQCGAADQTGVCRPRGGPCPPDCPGVCGCDGKFYCSACAAHQAGFDDSADRSCLPRSDAGGKL